MRKTLGIIIVLIGVALVAFSLIIKCYMFGFSNIDGSEHITIYAYTLNEEKTKEKVNDYFSDVFAIATSEAKDLRARDISAGERHSVNRMLEKVCSGRKDNELFL